MSKTSNNGFHEDPFPDVSSDITPKDPFSNKFDRLEEATALKVVFIDLCISNSGEVRDPQAHEPEREPEE